VDVFIPTFNEAPIVMTTAIACTQLDYPREKLNIFILDDGATEEKRNDPDPEKAERAWDRFNTLRPIAETLGVIYHTRKSNGSAKAGNLNAALALHGFKAGVTSSAEMAAWLRENADPPRPPTARPGELILLLDCDHVPARDFLKHTVGYFQQDPKLFLVQTPHFFINPTRWRRIWAPSRPAPGKTRCFTGRSSWGWIFGIPRSSADRRRSCGGRFSRGWGDPGDTITEDAETAWPHAQV
jgi:cellulose synthase (UDP-forming)